MKQITRNRIAQMIVLSVIGLLSIYCTQRKPVSTSVSDDEPKSTTLSTRVEQQNSATIPSEPSKTADEEKSELPATPSTQSSATEQGERIPLLELDKSIGKELKSDEYHSYRIEAEASQYLQAEAMQKGIDVVVSIFDPSGKKVYEVDSPNGTEGPEPIYLITESKGRYRLEVRSLEKTAKAGKYEVKLEQLRASSQEDKPRAAAYKALGEAVLLGSQQDPKSREEAITRYEEAIRLFEEAQEETQAASSCNGLAALYYSKGDYSKAEPLYQRALAIREKIFGSDHPDVANSLNNLSGLYQDKGDYSKAEPLYQRALAIREKIFGSNHPDVAQSLNNLATLYNDKGDYSKTEHFLQRALAIREKIFGSDHPDVANSLNNLAVLYETKGDYSKAESLFQRALAIREKARGSDHPDVANSLNNLAGLYEDKGDYGKAEPLYQRSLAIFEEAWGSDHPDVANSLNNLNQTR